MARARNIKPRFYKNEDLAECNIWARYIYPGLWQLADSEGRLEDRPKRIKAELLPFDEGQSIDKLLQELHDRKFILRYEAFGKRVIQVLKFKAHQNPHFREKPDAALIPPPSALLQSLGLVLTEEGYVPGAGDLFQGGEASGQPHTGRAESPIPESLKPISGDKGGVGRSPSDHPPGRKNGHQNPSMSAQEMRAEAVRILEFFNERAGRTFPPVKSNVDLLVGRIREGASPEQLRGVIARKCREWKGNAEMEQYLRPATLFGPKNFWSKYVGELGKQE